VDRTGKGTGGHGVLSGPVDRDRRGAVIGRAARGRQLPDGKPAGSGRIGARRPGRIVSGGLGQAYVDGLETLWTFLELELDRLTLFERAESVHLDGGVVHEYIGPPIRL
jgi:hypothetical protein